GDRGEGDGIGAGEGRGRGDKGHAIRCAFEEKLRRLASHGRGLIRKGGAQGPRDDLVDAPRALEHLAALVAALPRGQPHAKSRERDDEQRGHDGEGDHHLHEGEAPLSARHGVVAVLWASRSVESSTERPLPHFTATDRARRRGASVPTGAGSAGTTTSFVRRSHAKAPSCPVSTRSPLTSAERVRRSASITAS